MDPQVFSLILLFVLAAVTGGGIVAISAMIGRGTTPAGRSLPYECGIDPVGPSRRRMSVKFFLIAVLFIVFDVEIVFLYPWAVVFHDIIKSGGDLHQTVQGGAVFALAEVFIFIALLALALFYAWGRGALEWEK